MVRTSASEIRIPLNLSVKLFGCSYHLVPLLDFFPWLSTDTHIRFLAVHRILRWIKIWLALHILKPLSFPLIWIGIAESYPLLWPRYSTFKDVPLYFWCLPCWFIGYPDGWYLYLHHLYEPRTFYGSYSTGVTPGKNSNKTTSSKPRSELKGDTLKKWESTLNLRVHAHGTMYNLSWKLLVTIITP